MLNGHFSSQLAAVRDPIRVRSVPVGTLRLRAVFLRSLESPRHHPPRRPIGGCPSNLTSRPSRASIASQHKRHQRPMRSDLP
jgi:hypothetical protein